ncbi:hypothetical protein Tco_0237394 [Tanacetum coccineum]
MYNQKNVDYVALLWEDFMYQADNREISSARKEHMPYPRFTKVIIDHFISKDKTISMRNIINLHTVRDDPLLGTLNFVSKTDDTQKYGALIPDEMINQNFKDSKAYKTYYDFATGKVKPKKARNFKKVASPSRKLSPVLEAEPVKKAKRVKRPAKKSTTTPRTGVIIRDTLGVSVSKKKAPTKGDIGKGMELLFDAALLEAAQVPDESEDKTTGTDEGTSTKPGVPDVPTYESEIENESWGDNQDDESNDDDDDNDRYTKNGESKRIMMVIYANDIERTDSDDDENPSFTLKDYDEEEHDKEKESDDNYENVFEEEDDDVYKDVDARSLGAEHGKERKGDEEMTDDDQNVYQEKSYKQVIEDAHVTLTSSQKTESSKQSSYVSSDFASKFLILENVPPVVDEVTSMMNVKSHQEESSTQAPSLFTVPETAIPEIATAHATIVLPTILMITPLPQLTKPSPASTTVLTTTSILTLPDFSSLFGFDQRVSSLETELSQLKQADHSAQLLESVKSQLPTMVDDLLNVVEKSVKDIIKDEVKSLLPQILPKEVLNLATPVIQSTIMESLENVVFAKSSSQPQSTYKAATSLTEFELKKIQLDKLEKNKSYRAPENHKNLYDALVKSYQLDKDLFDSYGKAYSLKRIREDKDKD